MKDILTRMMQ